MASLSTKIRAVLYIGLFLGISQVAEAQFHIKTKDFTLNLGGKTYGLIEYRTYLGTAATEFRLRDFSVSCELSLRQLGALSIIVILVTSFLIIGIRKLNSRKKNEG